MTAQRRARRREIPVINCLAVNTGMITSESLQNTYGFQGLRQTLLGCLSSDLAVTCRRPRREPAARTKHVWPRRTISVGAASHPSRVVACQTRR